MNAIEISQYRLSPPLGVLGMARIDYASWFRFMIPLQVMLMLLGMLLLLPPLFWPLPGF